MSLEYGKPVPSDNPKKKMMVRVYNAATNRDRIIHFGDASKPDYHKTRDEVERAAYLAKSAEFTNRATGALTKDDPLSANYWSRRFLWDSGEKKVNVAAPAGTVLAGSPERPPPRRRSPRAKGGKKSPSKRASPKKAGAGSPKKTPAKKSPTKKSPAKKSPAKKSPAKKSPAKKSPGKKSPAKPASIKAATSPRRAFAF